MSDTKKAVNIELFSCNFIRTRAMKRTFTTTEIIKIALFSLHVSIQYVVKDNTVAHTISPSNKMLEIRSNAP